MHTFSNGRLSPQMRNFSSGAFRTLPFSSTDYRTQTTPYTSHRYHPVPPTFRDGLGAVTYREAPVTHRSLNMRVGPNPAPFLGVAPAAAGTVIAAGGIIGALLALVQENLSDSWTEEEVFRTNTSTIHNAMKTIQCIVGGAAQESFGCDEAGSCICPKGTPPLCPLPKALLTEWRIFRKEWSNFYKRTGSTGTALFGGATDGEAVAAKQFAVRMLDFYQRVEQVCPPSARKDLPRILPQAAEEAAKATTDPPIEKETPGWLKWGVVGVLGFAAIVGFKVISDVWD